MFTKVLIKLGLLLLGKIIIKFIGASLLLIADAILPNNVFSYNVEENKHNEDYKEVIITVTIFGETKTRTIKIKDN